MRSLRPALWGLATALGSLTMLLGMFSLSLVEGNMRVPAADYSPTVSPTPLPLPSREVTPTPRVPTTLPTIPPFPTLTPSLTSTPGSTITPQLTVVTCFPPSGWLPYTIKTGDTLEALALARHVTSLQLGQANCLAIALLTPGQVIHLPPPSTQTANPCGAAHNWVIYVVQPGDTLYHLGQEYGIPYSEIQFANCLTSIQIHTGQRLYVPPWAPHTPSPTSPGIPLPSDTPIATWTYIPTNTSSYPPTSTDTGGGAQPEAASPSPTETSSAP